MAPRSTEAYSRRSDNEFIPSPKNNPSKRSGKINGVLGHRKEHKLSLQSVWLRVLVRKHTNLWS